MNQPLRPRDQLQQSEFEPQESFLFLLNQAASSKDKDELSALSLSQSEAIRCKVAKNHFTSIETLQLLANDCRPCVRAAVAANPSTPNPTLAKLAHDEESTVRLAVAQSLDTNIELLRELALDRDQEVCSAARLTYNRVTEEKARTKKETLDNSKSSEKLIA